MKKILIIEDEQDIMDISTMILEGEGYDVHGFSGFDGYQNIINSINPDLILLDLNLQGRSGREICEYVKQDTNLKTTGVILMSANPDIERVKTESGADTFIKKPFDLKDFTETIKHTIYNSN